MKSQLFLIIKVIAVSIIIVTRFNAQFEIRFQPDKMVYVYECKGFGTPVSLYNAVIQNIAIINLSDETLDIENLEITASQGSEKIQEWYISNQILLESAQTFKFYETQGILQFYDFQFQTSRYLEGISFSENTSLSKKQAIVVPYRTLLFQSLPDRLTVKANGKRPDGTPIVIESGLEVINYRSENSYHFPVKGTWVAMGAPSLISHHRWGSIQEFALDLGKTGDNGITHIGDGTRLEHYLAFGEPVFAVGDGIVVSTYNEASDSPENMKQPDESDEEYMMRSMQAQQALLAMGFSYAMGNHVIIQHDHGEYSHYLHLKTGSVLLKTGDVVKKGQQIASLGNSGNSTEPHLHFHMTDGPDMTYSRSIPVTFDNIIFYPDNHPDLRHIHYGQILITKD